MDRGKTKRVYSIIFEGFGCSLPRRRLCWESIIKRRFLSIVALTHNTFAYLILIELSTYLEIPDIKSQNQKKKKKNK